MNVSINDLGYLAAVCTTGAFIPQVWMVWRERGAPGISTGMYLIFIAGVFFWFCYGMAIRSWPVIIANALTLALAGGVLGMKWYFERKPAQGRRPLEAIAAH
jgi:MtN3 and saliva related transmembrane protein